jgi:type I restriction enzyme S subunit
MTGTNPNIQKINQKTILAMPFPVKTSLTEQRGIVARLNALQAMVNVLKRLQAETAAELNALLPSILDKAFKGEL